MTHCFSSKGAWVMSSSRAVHEALSLEHLTYDGLVSLFTIWQTLTAKDLNRPVRTRTPGGVGEGSAAGLTPKHRPNQRSMSSVSASLLYYSLPPFPRLTLNQYTNHFLKRWFREQRA